MAVAVVAAWRVLVSIETPRFVPAGEGSFVAARDTRIENIVLDGDGTTAYVVATIGSVNLWRMLTG